MLVIFFFVLEIGFWSCILPSWQEPKEAVSLRAESSLYAAMYTRECLPGRAVLRRFYDRAQAQAQYQVSRLSGCSRRHKTGSRSFEKSVIGTSYPRSSFFSIPPIGVGP